MISVFTLIIKKIKYKLDKISPYPVLYPFIMSSAEKVVFDDAIMKSSNYLEFGLGGSTLRAIQKSKAKIYVVESDAEWINKMREYLIIKYFENRRLFIYPIDIGPTLRWGYPETNKYRDLFITYSSSIFNVIDNNAIDLVLIDGRFRVACALKVILSCYKNKKIKILVHDFWDRKQYHIILKYLDVIKKADNISLFSIKKILI